MDLRWVSDMSPRKCNSYLPNSTGQETSSFGARELEDTSFDRLRNATPFGNSTPQVSGLPSVRRPRADTMPSRTTEFPYATTPSTDHSTSSTTLATPSGSDLYHTPTSTTPTGGGGAVGPNSSLAIPFADAGRRRSGSVNLLPSSNRPLQDYGRDLFNSDFQPYMMEENASDAVQRTLASLGLDDSHQSSQYMQSATSLRPSQQQQQQQQQQRHRAYTVSTRHPSATSGDHLGDMLPMGFTPFSPQTRSSVMQRPRAVSLGMADEPHFGDGELSSFTPFDMSSTQQQQQQHYSHNQQHSPSRLNQQMLSNTERSLRMSRSSGNLMDISSAGNRFDGMGLYENISVEDMGQQEDINTMPSVSSSTLDSPSSAPAQIPSRALWLGNVNPSLSVSDLLQQFSLYGHVESARILSDKECAFVNFTNVESAVAAKNDLETRLGSMLGGTLVRIGFGKADVALAMALTNEAGPNAQGPTRALWVGNIPSSMNIAILQAIFQAFGPIESVRVLSHKNCAFVNFEHQEDAVKARKNLQNKEILGPGSGTIRIGFAKAPSAEDLNNAEPGFVSISASSQQQLQQQPQQQQRMPSYIPHGQSSGPGIPAHYNVPTNMMPASSNNSNNDNSNPSPTDTYQATQWATAMMMSTMMMNASGKQPTTQQPSLYSAIAAERQFIMQQFYPSTDATHLPLQGERIPITYYSVIPAVPELNSDRTLEPLRLRDMRKRLENGLAQQDVEMVAHECMSEIAELCSDYIGNTVVQKLFEQCTESTKETMLKSIAPYLASIGVHKNGTWAAQKIIDHANTPGQIQLIQQHIAPYVPLLLLDQFGNYVVQCCLRMGTEHNQYIFDAIVDKCWEIGQGRFGARAVRAILENDVVSKEQKMYCAAAIVQNAVLLTTNANGTLLLVWLLDTSELPGRYSVLYPRLLPYLSKLCTHKLGSMTVYKIIQQQEEPETSRLFLNALTTDAQIRDEILQDQTHGMVLMQKILALPHHDSKQRAALIQQIRSSLNQLHVQQSQNYKKLMEEMDSVKEEDDHAEEPQPPADEQLPMDMISWMKNPQAVAMMANMYAAAMTAAATSHQQQQQVTSMMNTPPELPQFNHILKHLLSSTSASSSSSTSANAESSNENHIHSQSQH